MINNTYKNVARADEIKLWLTNQSLVIVCIQANINVTYRSKLYSG